jgi:hypothetical protein
LPLLLFLCQVVAQSFQQTLVAFGRDKANLAFDEFFGQRKQVAEPDK